MSLAYGIPIKPRDDPHLMLSELTLQTLLPIFTPGSNFVDIFPSLKYLPKWFPGAGFKRMAAELYYMADKFRSSPFDAGLSLLVRTIVYAQISVNVLFMILCVPSQHQGTEKARPSFISVGLEAIDPTKPDAENQTQILKDAAAMFYGAGTDTIAATLLTWIWVMMKNPEAQARVHAELDAVLRDNQMPDFEDEEALPYLSATLMEATR